MFYVDKTEITVEEGVTFDIKKNVKSVTTDVNTSQKTYKFYNDSINNDPEIFLIIDCPYHMAFAHWIYESAIFLQYFKYFNGACLLLNANPHRDYKLLFCKLFGINKIRWLDNKSENNDIPANNICIISRNFTLNDKSRANSENHACLTLYKTIVLNFRNHIVANKFDYVKDNDHLFLPRNSTQNYAGNDRTVDYTHINALLSGKKYIEYNTSDTVDFNDQIKLVSRSKNIYLDWGSNLLVNGLFSKGSTIYCVNKMPAQLDYPFLRIVYNIIEDNNTVILL
jgi:hypothetical protein